VKRNQQVSDSRMPADTLVMTSYPPAWDALAAITCATHKKWADRHGYHYHADRSDLRDNYFDHILQKQEKLPVKGFVKLDLLLHYLPKYKYVVWLDADGLLTAPEISLDDLLAQAPKTDIIMPFDHNTHNATVIISRSTDLVWDFWWACRNTGWGLFGKHPWAEMEAARYFSSKPPYENLIGYMSIKTLCGILPEQYEPYLPTRVSAQYGWKPGDFFLHLSALHIDRRIEIARQYATDLGLV